jgi:hypothetical protein
VLKAKSSESTKYCTKAREKACESVQKCVKSGVHNSILSAGKNYFFACLWAKNDMFLHIKGCFNERNKLNKKILGLAGQI